MKTFGTFLILLLFFYGIAAAAEIPAISTPLKVQILLDRAGFSPGEIDGSIGKNTMRALEVLQKQKGLNVTGRSNEQTLAALTGDQDIELLMSYTITDQDVSGPFIQELPKDYMEQAKLPALDYTSPIEELGERFHCSPALLKSLNKDVQFQAGDQILVPNVEPLEAPVQSKQSGELQVKGKRPHTRTQTNHANQAFTVTVDQQTSSVSAVNDSGEIVFYAPATLGSEHDPLPIGEWKIIGISRNPVFNYNPELFWEANPEHAKAKIPAGPNNPVGVVWMEINKEHYGMHGTPEPGRIGYTESNGCIRMTNWDASKLASMVKPGTKVIFQ